MAKIFYDHLVLIEDLFVEIDLLDLTAEEKKAAKKMADEIMHHRVFTRLLDLLPKEHHQEFLKRFHKAPHEARHLHFLAEKTQIDMHAEIVLTAEKVKRELSREIKKHKKH